MTRLPRDHPIRILQRERREQAAQEEQVAEDWPFFRTCPRCGHQTQSRSHYKAHLQWHLTSRGAIASKGGIV